MSRGWKDPGSKCVFNLLPLSTTNVIQSPNKQLNLVKRYTLQDYPGPGPQVDASKEALNENVPMHETQRGEETAAPA